MALTIQQAVKRLLIREPFYGLYLVSIDKYFSEVPKTACITKKGINPVILINKSFWDARTDDECLFILMHEVNHLLLGHLTTNWSQYTNRERLNIAMDCEINGAIDIAPKWCAYPHLFKLESRMGTAYYYENLPENVENMFEGFSDDHDWKEFEKLSDAEKTLFKNQIDHLAKETASNLKKHAGKIPGHLIDYIESLFKDRAPVFNWKSYFRRALGNSIKTYIKSTRYKPSYRFKDQPGNMVKFKPSILVAVDTSGSVDNDELTEFFTEIRHIYKAGVNVDVVEFDTEIEHIFTYKGQATNIEIHGRGGTDATDAFKYYIEHNKYSSLVVFTDGYLSTDLPKARNVIWVITSNGYHQDYPGISIHIPNK